MIPLTTKLIACLNALRHDDLDELPPARRERLAQALRYWAKQAERPPEKPKPRNGVLFRLGEGERAE